MESQSQSTKHEARDESYLRTIHRKTPSAWLIRAGFAAICVALIFWWLRTANFFRSEGTLNEVIVYTALDEGFARSIYADFEATSGIRVRPKFDNESTKTVGLTQAILAERNRPRCDLFWNNEILNTLRLERAGLLRVYRSPSAANYPASAKSPHGTWHGFAARARVLIVNTKLLPRSSGRPDSVRDLANPSWQNQCGLAKPLFGTTATHAAVLFALWDDAEAKTFFRKVKNNVRVLAGNKQVALDVAAGRFAWGLTDTDDAIIELEKGMPVALVYPDQADGAAGTLFIPNTLALIRDSPHAQEAEQLVDYLLRPEVEAKLARGRSAQIPLNPAVDIPLRIESPHTIRAMHVDWNKAAEKWDSARTFLTDVFATAE